MRIHALTLGAGLALLACSESTTDPVGEGTLIVSVTTDGGDPDLDGYLIRIDDGIWTSVGSNGEETYVVVRGQHTVELAGVAPTCVVAGDSRRTVTAVQDQETRVQFVVGCAVTGISVSATTLGIDLDLSGYQITLNGVPRGTVPANGALVISRLTPGEYTIGVHGVAANCALEGDPPRTLTIAYAEVTNAAFSVSCTATFGVIRIEVATTGSRPDTQYTAHWSPDPAFRHTVTALSMLSNALAYVSPVAGARYVRLINVAGNCSVAGGKLRDVTVATGGLVRDTAVARFEVTCAEGNGTIRVTVATSGDEIPAEFSAHAYQGGGCCDSRTDHPVAVDGQTSIVVPGDTYSLYLDTGTTCRPPGFRSFDLGIGSTVDLEYRATCGRPWIRVSAPTTGPNADTEYTVVLRREYEGQTELGTLAAGGTLEHRTSPDYMRVTLEGVATNCTVGVANPTAWFYLRWEDVREVVFPVTCGP